MQRSKQKKGPSTKIIKIKELVPFAHHPHTTKRTRHNVSKKCAVVFLKVKSFPTGKCHSTSVLFHASQKKSIKQPRSTLHWPRVKTHPASTATSDTLVCHRLSLCNPLCLPQHHTTTRKEKSSNKTKPYSRLVAFAFLCAGVTLPRKQPYAGTDTHHVPQLTSSQAQTQKKRNKSPILSHAHTEVQAQVPSGSPLWSLCCSRTLLNHKE
eukprot:m.276555 g.276555  ORF g.276555 m.276555 type:complete len:209 (+) comp15713_c2_seq2:6689-7315(+)